jgi:hypothetical protein
MLLFRSEEHVDRWSQRRGLARGAMLSLDQLWGLARIWYADRMTADWRRRTPQEAEQVFAGLGLTGDFWRLA